MFLSKGFLCWICGDVGKLCLTNQLAFVVFFSAFFAFLLFWFIHFHVEQYLSLSSCKGGFLLEFYYIAILILVPIKLVSKLLIAGSPWMVLTCLEGSSEAEN